MEKLNLIIILGPTAVGKTKLSIDLAKRLSTEIISGDSMLVYKGFDIGTAKPTKKEMAGVKHHIIDILEPWQSFNVSDFQEKVKPLIKQLNDMKKIPILAGGTGLYIKSLVEGYVFNKTSRDNEYRLYLEKLAQKQGKEYVYNMLKQVDEKTAQRLHINNFNRIIRALEVYHSGKEQISQQNHYEATGNLVYNAYIIGLNRQRQHLYERINQRVDMMIDEGFIDEVKTLLVNGAKLDWQSMKGIGYREIASYLQGEMSLDKAIEEMKKATRHFAKRQFTWYKKMPYISWYDVEQLTAEKLLDEVTNDCRKYFSVDEVNN